MQKRVQKRDGRLVYFDSAKIRKAIEKSVGNVDISDTVISTLICSIEKECDNIFSTKGACTVEDIQDVVIKELDSKGYKEISKEYSSYRESRNILRAKKSNLMQTYKKLTFMDASDLDIKRENANIDANTAMGTMLKYGSEGAKEFAHLYLLKPEHSKAHRVGDIHIHDLDFMGTGTLTCATEDTRIILKEKSTGRIFPATISYFDKYFKSSVKEVHYFEPILYETLSQDGLFVDVKNCARRPMQDDEKVYNLTTSTSILKLTGEHQVPVKRESSYLLSKVSDLLVGDELIRGVSSDWNLNYIDLVKEFGSTDDIMIVNSNDLRDYLLSKNLLSQCNKIWGKHRVKRNRYLSLKNYYDICHLMPKDDMFDFNRIMLKSKGAHTEEGIPQRLYLTRELGKIIGYMLSEGSFVKKAGAYTGVFCNTDIDLISDFDKCMSTVFPSFNLKEREYQDSRVGTRCHSSLFVKLFDGVLGYKSSSSKIKLPYWIYNANKDFLSGFFGALIDGDGSVDKGFYRVTYTSVCGGFIDELHYLLLLLGIDSSVREYESKGTEANFKEKGVTVLRNHNTYKLSIAGKNVKSCMWFDSSKIRDRYKEVTPNKRNDNNINKIELFDYSGFVYDIETGDNYFNANGYIIHNCCQIPLDKLFKGGFSTGHGFIREPNDIMSYSALACIAIQSNQNEQHSFCAII